MRSKEIIILTLGQQLELQAQEASKAALKYPKLADSLQRWGKQMEVDGMYLKTRNGTNLVEKDSNN